MFSHQYTRQLSTSPPPFSDSTQHFDDYTAIGLYPESSSSSYESFSASPPQSSMYSPSFSQSFYNCLPSIAPPCKQEYFAEDDMNPFSMSYASLAGMDVTRTQSFQGPLVAVSVQSDALAQAPIQAYHHFYSDADGFA